MKLFFQRNFLLIAIIGVVVFDAVVFHVAGLNALSTVVYCVEAVSLVVVLYSIFYEREKFVIQWSFAILCGIIVLIRPIETQIYFTVLFLVYTLRVGLEAVLSKKYDAIQPVLWFSAIFSLFQGLRVRIVPEIHLLQPNPLDDILGIWLIFFGIWTLRWALIAIQEWQNLNEQFELNGKELSFTKGALALSTHHLKNPLSIALLAMGGARLGKRSNGKIEIDQGTFDRIESAISRSALMVNELVENQNSIYRLQKEEITLNEIIVSTQEQFEEKVQFHLTASKVKVSATTAFVIRLAITTHLSNSIEHGGDEIELLTSKDQIMIKDNGAGLPKNYSASYGKQVLGSRANRGMGAYQTAVLLESVGWRQELIVGQGFGIKIFPLKDENKKSVSATSKLSLHQQIH